MSTTALSKLCNQRTNYRDKLADARQQLTRYERAYETLREFKTVVARSEEEFHAINSSKRNVLFGLEHKKTNSLVTSGYQMGMQATLVVQGSGKVGNVYTALLDAISDKIQSYSNIINGYDEDISFYENKIADLDEEIREMKEEKDESMREVK